MFDGAVIEARRKTDGERVGVQRADRNGRVVFHLPEGRYRFGPAEGIENRLRGVLNLEIRSKVEAHLLLSLK